ncbi:MAG: sterol desaturase family protein [Bacteroidota bacterium]|nr:sterol desaturase family protein [Bacteroidota bacterium]
MKNYISNEDKSARMFQSGFMELFTHVHPATPLVLFLPVVAYSLHTAYGRMGISMQVSLVIAGLFVWTLTEYLLHREIFHFQPESLWGKRLHFIMHGVHHDYPNDSRRLVMAPAISIPLAAFFFILFKNIFGRTYVFPFFAGFITGYLMYDMMHYAIHHFPMRGKMGTYLKKHHFRHHYMDSDINFGVSSPLWDVVFRTLNEEQKQKPTTQDITFGSSAGTK